MRACVRACVRAERKIAKKAVSQLLVVLGQYSVQSILQKQPRKSRSVSCSSFLVSPFPPPVRVSPTPVSKTTRSMAYLLDPLLTYVHGMLQLAQSVRVSCVVNLDLLLPSFR